MALSNKKGTFPLVDLTIRGLKAMHFWNESPGKPFSTLGLILLVLYPTAWLIPSWLFIVSSQDNLTLLMKAANEQIVFMTIFFKLCVFVLNFHRWEQVFYDLQRAFSFVMNDQSLDIQGILGHVQKSAHFLTRGYTSLLCFNCALYGIFPMLFVAVKYAITGSYDVPLSTPIEANSARTLEDILSFQMLFLYMSTVFALCLMVTVLSLAFKDVFLLIAMICVIGYCLFQTFSFSYLGTELIEESGAVADAIFHSTWYKQNVKRQKDLSFVLMRAKRPVKLNAGKLFIVTRDSFTEVIKQAYTIFTLMSQFLEDTAT
uniref:Odorant receptor n=1 Tax=Anopheles maculatus TaxID=74869 RepID=A0A182SW14_9DIPT